MNTVVRTRHTVTRSTWYAPTPAPKPPVSRRRVVWVYQPADWEDAEMLPFIELDGLIYELHHVAD